MPQSTPFIRLSPEAELLIEAAFAAAEQSPVIEPTTSTIDIPGIPRRLPRRFVDIKATPAVQVLATR